MESLSGKVVGHYKLHETLGAPGATGTVYHGKHVIMDRPAAVKILTGSGEVDRRKIRRFIREARILASLEHEHIVPIYDAGFDEAHGVFYTVTRLVKGLSLAQVLREQGHLDVFKCEAIMNQIADALDYAHEQQIYHLDLKPSNILIETSSSSRVAGWHAYLIDFGFALQREEASRGGHLYGTYSYWSPEQALGRRLDHRTDLYCLATVLYQMLTGHLPFDRPDPTEVLRDIVSTAPTSPSQFNPSFPPSVDAFFIKALSKDRRKRFQTCHEMTSGLYVSHRCGTVLKSVIARTCGFHLAMLSRWNLVEFLKQVDVEKQEQLIHACLALICEPEFVRTTVGMTDFIAFLCQIASAYAGKKQEHFSLDERTELQPIQVYRQDETMVALPKKLQRRERARQLIDCILGLDDMDDATMQLALTYAIQFFYRDGLLEGSNYMPRLKLYMNGSRAVRQVALEVYQEICGQT